jgi:hypothetical protein
MLIFIQRKFAVRAMRSSVLLCLVPVALCAAASPSPANVAISNAATANITCSGGLCAPTAADAVLNVQDLEAMLASGNATVTTTGSGVQAVNIRVNARLTWSAGTTLALDAFRSIELDGAMKVAGTGAVSLTSNDGGSGGEFACESGRLQFNNLSSTLTINGTPYTLVNSIASLASAIVANPSGAFALARNYDAKKDGTYATSPIPTFNGLGNTISNLSINDPTENANVGFFAETATGSTITNIRLDNENVQGGSGTSEETGSFIGGLVGYATAGAIAHSFVSGTVSGGAYVSVGGLVGLGGSNIAASGSSATVSTTGLGNSGGLIGGTSAPINDSYATGNVSGYGFVGGLAGFIAVVPIIRSWASGAVVGQDNETYAGGLAGINDSGIVDRSHASGAVTCQFVCGGLVGIEGYNGGLTPKLSKSFATGTVVSTEGAGGLAGLNQIGEISDSYATGAVSGQEAGGLVAQNINYGGYRAISNSYSTGVVTGQSGETGGLLGGDEFTSTIKHTYWDMTTSGITDPSEGAGNVANDPGIKGLSDSQLKSALPKGFNPKIWNENSSINGGLPYLLANPPQSWKQSFSSSK